MSTQTERIETVVTWETSGATKGAGDVQKAFERMGKAEENSIRAAQAREARLAQQQKSNRERALRDLEKMEKESADRRVRETQRMYREMDKSAQFRSAALQKELRVAGSAVGRAAGIGGGSHGSGMLGGGNARFVGDLLDQLTGTRGNVMRMNALQHMLPMLGRFAAPAMVGAAGAFAASKLIGARLERAEDTNALRHSLGETTEGIPWRIARQFGPAGLAAMRMFGDESGRFTPGRIDAQSDEGIRAQREEIRKGMDKMDHDRMGFWSRLSGADYAGMDVEGRAMTKLEGMDSTLAGRVASRTAAERMSAFGSEYGGALEQNRIGLEEKQAALEDERSAGKIGPYEYQQAKRRAEAEREIADAHADQAKFAADRENSLKSSENYIRGRGEDVAQRSAYARFQAASDAADKAPTDEAKARAKIQADAAYQEYVDAERSTRERKTTLAIDRDIADFRGGSEQRALNSARKQVELHEQLLSIAKEKGSDAEREAQVRLSQAKLQLDLTIQEQAVRREMNAAARATGAVGIGSAVFRLGQSIYSPNESTRFAAGQSIERHEAAAGVQRAEIALDAANQRVDLEHHSEESVQAQAMAQQKLTEAKLEQLDIERKLNAEAVQRSRHLQAELDAAQNETAAMRLSNSGRPDLADLRSSRAHAQAQALEYERQGRHDMADQVLEQQRQHEIGLYDAKYLRPDGRRKSRHEIAQEERTLRRTERRRNRVNSRLERDMGLIHVHRDMAGNILSGMDPLTKENISAGALHQRAMRAHAQAEAERRQDAQNMPGNIDRIRQILDKRLPSSTT